MLSSLIAVHMAALDDKAWLLMQFVQSAVMFFFEIAIPMLPNLAHVLLNGIRGTMYSSETWLNNTGHNPLNNTQVNSFSF